MTKVYVLAALTDYFEDETYSIVESPLKIRVFNSVEAAKRAAEETAKAWMVEHSQSIEQGHLLMMEIHDNGALLAQHEGISYMIKELELEGGEPRFRLNTYEEQLKLARSTTRKE